MTSIYRTFALATLCVSALSLSACAGMSRQDKSAVGGAAIGGVAGSILSDGSALGTVGGAAVGGLIGNEVGKKK